MSSKYNLDSIPEGVELSRTSNLHDANVLKWSGVFPIPTVGQRVDRLYVLGIECGGTVTGYFVEYDWVGIHVKLDYGWKNGNGEKKGRDFLAFGMDLISRQDQDAMYGDRFKENA